MASLIFNSPSIFTIHQDLDAEKPPIEFENKEQFIGLMVGTEDFLLPILTVREIIMLPDIAFVPNATMFIEGVINLRGTIIPTVSLRKIMGMSRPRDTKSARVVVTKSEQITLGLIVDAITNVISLQAKDIQKHSIPLKGAGSEFIGPICKFGPKVKGILDLNRIVNTLLPANANKGTEKTSA